MPLAFSVLVLLAPRAISSLQTLMSPYPFPFFLPGTVFTVGGLVFCWGGFLPYLLSLFACICANRIPHHVCHPFPYETPTSGTCLCLICFGECSSEKRSSVSA